MTQDMLHKFLAFKDEIRVYSVESKQVLQSYLENVTCSAVTIAAIGRLMSGALLMGAMLKNDEKLLLTIQGNGPLEMLQAEADGIGNVRGFVKNPLCEIPLKENGHLDVSKAVGDMGILTVKKQLNLKEPFVGTSELISGEIAEDISYYFGTSEQTPTVVGLGVLVDVDYSVAQSGGFIIQMLPNASEEAYTYVESLLKKITSVSELIKEYGPKDLVTYLFEDARLLESYPVQFKCNCSFEYAKTLLQKIDENELKEMIEEDKGIEITCNFCQKKYYLSTDELKTILEEKRCLH